MEEQMNKLRWLTSTSNLPTSHVLSAAVNNAQTSLTSPQTHQTTHLLMP